jgi:hypothetical protein
MLAVTLVVLDQVVWPMFSKGDAKALGTLPKKPLQAFTSIAKQRTAGRIQQIDCMDYKAATAMAA